MAFGLRAQFNYSYDSSKNGNRRYYSKPESVNKYRKFTDVKIREVTQTYFRKDKVSFVINYKYNLASRICEISSKDRKNRGSVSSFKYENDTLLTALYSINKDGDTSYTELIKFNEKNKCIEEKKFIKNKLERTDNITWNENGFVKKSEVVYEKNKEWNSRSEYEYYDDNKLKEVRYYKNNILVHKYSYACSPAGEKVGLNKEESKICTINNKNEDGSFYIISEENNGKKGISRYIQKFTPDSLITSYEIYDLDGRLRHKYVYQYENKKLVKEERFNRNKRYSSDYFIYGTDNLLIASYRLNKRGKKIRDYKYTYAKYE